MKTDEHNEELKYALLVARSMNVGDDIQSIAALRFLPRVDLYIERDRLDRINVDNNTKEIKMIMNGWFLGGVEYWPPMSSVLNPLITSLHVNHINRTGPVVEAFKKEDSIKYLKAHSPIGARDKSSLKILRDEDIDAYFSACLTLTLNGVKKIKKQEHILAVNVSDEVYEALKERTSRKIIRMDVNRTQETTVEEDIALAKYYLYMYQSAHCVVTTRLHATLPTIAIGGKVLFIVESNPDNKDFNERFEGLFELAHHMSRDEFLLDSKGAKYDINKPPSNPTSYLKYRKELEKLCVDYTGHDEEKDYLENETFESLVGSGEVYSAITKLATTSWHAYMYKVGLAVPDILKAKLEHYDSVEKDNTSLKKENEALHRQLHEANNPELKEAIKRTARSLKRTISNR